MLTVELTSVVVTSVYKPPTVDFNFPQHVPLKHNKSQIIIGDFNSHSTQWGYKDKNKDGIAVEEWIDSNKLSLIHDPKLPTSFQSAHWKWGYNPDLAIVSNDISNLCKKIVLNPVPQSQHRPIGIQVKAAITPNIVPFKRRFNYKKADWKGFAKELEQNVRRITPIAQNYDIFADMVRKSARPHIPRGCRVEYIPGLSDEITKEYLEYVTMFEADPFSKETSTKGEKVMEHISKERQKTWHSLTESTDMSRNSKKAWSTIGKIRGAPTAAPCQPSITANQVAHQLLLNGKNGSKVQTKIKLNCKKYNSDPGFQFNSIQFKLYFTFVAKWPNYRKYYIL